jgi:hypothetical protein
MSNATNPLLIVERKLWDLVIAWPALSTDTTATGYVRPGNRIRFDQLGIPWPEAKQSRKPADSIELKLDIPGGSRPDRNAARTFCLQPQVNVWEFVWTVSAADKRLNYLTQALAELRACMIAAGTQLGIPGTVARWEEESRPGRGEVNERVLVWVQKITIKG